MYWKYRIKQFYWRFLEVLGIVRPEYFFRVVLDENEKRTKRLLKKDPCILTARDSYGRTPLHIASECVARLLIVKGADLSAKDNDGQSPLHYAREQEMKLFLEKGADPNVKDYDGRTPLHRWLSLETSLNIEEVCSIVRMLLAAGANVNAKDHYGNTPLHNAARTSYNLRHMPTPLEILLAKGADVNQRNSVGLTPLHLAASIPSPELRPDLQALLKAGAKVNAKDKKGRTPLHLAMKNSSVGASKYLLDYRADVSIRDSDGRVPPQYLRKGNLPKEREEFSQIQALLTTCCPEYKEEIYALFVLGEDIF